jgi:hypothetical protein
MHCPRHVQSQILVIWAAFNLRISQRGYRSLPHELSSCVDVASPLRGMDESQTVAKRAGHVGLALPQDGDVWVGIFPEREKFLIWLPCRFPRRSTAKAPRELQIDILPLCQFKPLNPMRLPRAKGAAASLDVCLAQLLAMHSDFRAKPSPVDGRKGSTRNLMVIVLSLGAE